MKKWRIRRDRAWGCYLRQEGHAERQRPHGRVSVTALRGQRQAGRGPASFKAHRCCQGTLSVQAVARRSAWLKSREVVRDRVREQPKARAQEARKGRGCTPSGTRSHQRLRSSSLPAWCFRRKNLSSCRGWEVGVARENQKQGPKCCLSERPRPGTTRNAESESC